MGFKRKDKLVAIALLIVLLVGNFYSLKLSVREGLIPCFSLVYILAIVPIFVYILRGNIPFFKYIILYIVLFIGVEVLLYFFSPYKSYGEKSGDFYFKFVFHPAHVPSKVKPDPESIAYPIGNSEFEFIHTVNSLGYRDDEVPKDSIDVIIIGDSFIEGAGVSQASAPDKLIERHLGCNSCVFNMGIIGSDLYNSFQYLEELIHIHELSPRSVILNINSTDIQDLQMHAKFYGYDFFNEPSFMLQLVYGSSYFLRHIIHDVLGYNFMLLPNKHNERIENEVCDEMIEIVKRYNDFCRKRKINFMVAMQPLQHELETAKSSLEMLILGLKQSDVKFVNILSQEFPIRKVANELYWPIDQHFNEKGYKWYISELYHKTEEKYPKLLQE